MSWGGGGPVAGWGFSLGQMSAESTRWGRRLLRLSTYLLQLRQIGWVRGSASPLSFFCAFTKYLLLNYIARSPFIYNMYWITILDLAPARQVLQPVLPCYIPSAVYATQTTTAHVCCSLQHDRTCRFAVCPWFIVSRISAFHNNPAPFR